MEPLNSNDPIDMLLRGPMSRHLIAVVAQEVNYRDNPWFPDVLKGEMEYDRDHETLTNISTFGWATMFSNSEARVFRNWKHRRLRNAR
jgi:phage terminase large subunit